MSSEIVRQHRGWTNACPRRRPSDTGTLNACGNLRTAGCERFKARWSSLAIKPIQDVVQSVPYQRMAANGTISAA